MENLATTCYAGLMLTTLSDAVVLDMDGLLLDSEAIQREAIRAACEDQGRSIPDEVHFSLIGTPKDMGDVLLIAHFGDDFDLDVQHAGCRTHFEALAADGVPLRPGAAGLLWVLAELSIPAAIATSTARDIVELRLARAGVAGAFRCLATRTDVLLGKPHPETFLKVAGLLGVDPARCLALENSYNGVRAAAAAGMVTVMVPDLLPATLEMEGLCAAIVLSLADVADALLAVAGYDVRDGCMIAERASGTSDGAGCAGHI